MGVQGSVRLQVGCIDLENVGEIDLMMYGA